MKKSFSLLLAAFLLLAGSDLLAQAKPYVINGKVISFEESFALEGVSVYVKGTNNNTGTQADGTFSLEIHPENKVLVIELKDFESQEVAISGKKQYDIVLKRNSNQAKGNTSSTSTGLFLVNTAIILPTTLAP